MLVLWRLLWLLFRCPCAETATFVPMLTKVLLKFFRWSSNTGMDELYGVAKPRLGKRLETTGGSSARVQPLMVEVPSGDSLTLLGSCRQEQIGIREWWEHEAKLWRKWERKGSHSVTRVVPTSFTFLKRLWAGMFVRCSILRVSVVHVFMIFLTIFLTTCILLIFSVKGKEKRPVYSQHAYSLWHAFSTRDRWLYQCIITKYDVQIMLRGDTNSYCVRNYCSDVNCVSSEVWMVAFCLFTSYTALISHFYASNDWIHVQ